MSISPQVLEKLNSYSWPEIMPTLVYHAGNEIRKSKIYGRFGGREMVVGKTAEDVVSDTITKIYAGERRWDPQKIPDLTDFLFMVIKSEIRNLIKDPENRDTIEGDAPVSLIEGESRTFISEALSSLSYPNQQLLEKECEEMADDFLTGFLEYIEDDKELTAIMQCVLDGKTKKQEIAEALGLDVDVIYNAWKRMQRKVDKYCGSPGREQAKRFIEEKFMGGVSNGKS